MGTFFQLCSSSAHAQYNIATVSMISETAECILFIGMHFTWTCFRSVIDYVLMGTGAQEMNISMKFDSIKCTLASIGYVRCSNR